MFFKDADFWKTRVLPKPLKHGQINWSNHFDIICESKIVVTNSMITRPT